MKEFGKYIAVNRRDEELGGNQLIIRIPTVLTVTQAKQVIKDMNAALLYASPSFVKPGMTREEALLEAQRRWGVTPEVRIFDRMTDSAGDMSRSIGLVGRYWVGEGLGPIHGNGNSWEEAFADAETREDKPFFLRDIKGEGI